MPAYSLPYADREMQRALEGDGEKLRQLTGEDHGPWPLYASPELSGLMDAARKAETAIDDILHGGLGIHNVNALIDAQMALREAITAGAPRL